MKIEVILTNLNDVNTQ